MRFEPRPPWTRDHERLVRAWEQLHQAHASRGNAHSARLADWVWRKFGERSTRRLSASQARQGRRCLNAWRAGVEGRSTVWRRYPRQERRNYRRALNARGWSPAEIQAAVDRAIPLRTAINTATSPYAPDAEPWRGTVLEALGRVSASESAR